VKKNTAQTERHIRITHAMLNSPAFIALDASAQALFLSLRVKLNGSNNGNISAPFSELKHRRVRSSTTLAKALRQLEAVGLIRKTRLTVGVERGSKVCNLYRFTDLDVYEHPKLHVDACRATHEYKHFASLAEARGAIVRASPPQKKRTRQKLVRHEPESAAISKKIAADSGIGSLPLNPEIGRRRDPSIRGSAGAAPVSNGCAAVEQIPEASAETAHLL
jgi:hypothetical protein